jgi:uncharacterized protein (TIRG00374 family)
MDLDNTYNHSTISINIQLLKRAAKKMDAKPKLTRKTVFLPIVGLAAFFLYILLFNVDIPDIIATARKANLLVYSLAILISFVEIFFYAVSWRELLRNLQVKISIARSYLFVWYGNFMDILIPAESISGEICRMYLVNREQGGTGGKAAASVIAQRIIGMIMNIAFLIVGISLLYTETQINLLIFNLILFFAVAITGIIALLLLVSAKEKWSRKIITSLARVGEVLTRGKWKRLNQFKEEALKESLIFHDSMKELIRKPQKLIIPTLFLALNWICSMLIPFLVFLSLGYQTPWSVIIITSSIVVAVKSIPIGVPFEVGLPEITMTTLYTSLLGIQLAGLCATATILSRIITLWMRFGIGFLAQQWIELKSVLLPRNGKVTEKT